VSATIAGEAWHPRLKRVRSSASQQYEAGMSAAWSKAAIAVPHAQVRLPRDSAVARVLRWMSVGMLLAITVISSKIQETDIGAAKTAFTSQHVSLGLILLGLMIVRFSWRAVNVNPLESYKTATWQKYLSTSVHWFLYIVIIVQCLIGVCQMMTHSKPLLVFDVLIIEPVAFRYDGVIELFNDVHKRFANLIYVVIGLHVLAAIYHQQFSTVNEHED
jgi:cytochrome b561